MSCGRVGAKGATRPVSYGNKHFVAINCRLIQFLLNLVTFPKIYVGKFLQKMFFKNTIRKFADVIV